MTDWEKNTPFYERVLLDSLYPRKSKILYHLISKLFKKKIASTSIGLQPEDNPRLFIMSVGNSHLDSAWRWRKIDAREKKIEPTFSRNVYHLESNKFPTYSFSANAVVHYEWIRDDYPDLFAKIKNFVEEGRWEVLGGDWVEMDVNLSDGESLIRQRLIGQRFNAKEFQKITDIAWYDDVFGFCASLPQILAKTGARYFYTNKFCYSHFSYKFPPESPDYAGEEKFPFFHFLWESPDGSQVLCTWAQHKNNFHKHLKQFTKHSRTVSKEIIAQQKNKFDTSMNWPEIDANLSDEIIPLIVNVYGQGDGGMGPQPLEIMEQMILEDKGYVQNSPINKFFKLLEPYRDRLPVWKDELYLENHRGTLTSVGMIKENNHTAEVLLHQAEILSVFSGLLGAEQYQDELLLDWKTLLFLQFHDILPGSSIAEVYRDAAEDYNAGFHHIASCQESALMNIAHTLKTKIKKNYYSIFNPLGWERYGYATILARNFNQVMDSANTPLLVQKIAFTSSVNNRAFQLGMDLVPGTEYGKDTQGLTKLLEYEKLPKDKLLIYFPPKSSLGSFGLANMTVFTGADLSQKSSIQIKESEHHFTMDNSLIFLKIDKKTGFISFVGKNMNSPNHLSAKGIGYNLYGDDKTGFDAWNLDPAYHSKLQDFPLVDEISIEESGPLRATLLIKYLPTASKTTLHTRISLYHNESKIYGETLVDWQEEWKLLKLAVPTQFNNESVTCGAPYGVQVRSTSPKTVYQKAMYEFAYQQFAEWHQSSSSPENFDFSTVAFYSQSKYGMCANGGTAEFTLLKAPHFEGPDKMYAMLDDDFDTRSKVVDQGFHHIPWAIEFGARELDLMHVIRNSFEYNVPFLLLNSEVEHPKQEFVKINQSNVILTTLKEIEEYMQDAPNWFYKPQMSELAFIVRCVEYLGKESSCQISFDKSISLKRAQEVDMLERIAENGITNSDVQLNNNELTFTIHPYEIKSIMVIGRKILE